MTAQFRYVAGHIEVYSATGEFLFSADTMQEAWEDYQDEMSGVMRTDAAAKYTK